MKCGVSAGVPEKEREVLQKLKELVDKQRDELRSTEHELSLRNDDVEALQLQQKRVMKMNQELQHRLSVVEAQGKVLVQGKVEMEAVAQARTQELGQLRREVSRLQRELQDLETHVSSETADLSSVGNDTDSDGSESEAPHFTLQELRDVLYEKNQLKAQVLVLQEELAYYKQESDEDYSESVCGPYEDNTDSAAAAEEEPESGIRKLIFTAIMPMVAAGLISDDPALMPIRRLVSIS
uniref:RH2 domain-containing protein n=1 Tax=Knipowitschia caucasica TaxID=637954 RepID=A0AAV2JEW7_KNICA